jgi:hypothetical protein
LNAHNPKTWARPWLRTPAETLITRHHQPAGSPCLYVRHTKVSVALQPFGQRHYCRTLFIRHGRRVFWFKQCTYCISSDTKEHAARCEPTKTAIVIVPRHHISHKNFAPFHWTGHLLSPRLIVCIVVCNVVPIFLLIKYASRHLEKNNVVLALLQASTKAINECRPNNKNRRPIFPPTFGPNDF